MDRRQVLVGLSVTFGAGLITPLARVLAAGADPVALTGAKPVFDDAARADLAALAETIIPTTDTPGAIKAGVPQFIEFMLAEWYKPDERALFEKGLRELAAHCQKTQKAAFAKLTAQAQNDVVAAMEKGGADGFHDGGKELFDHAKQLTMAGYYTSEIGMTVEREYVPVPGRYDGAYPYDKVGKVFTG